MVGVLLSPDLLAEFEVRLRRLNPPVVSRWRPGLRPDQIIETAGSAGVSIPTEAQVWWQWRDGAPFVGERLDSRWIGPGYTFLPLTEALERYKDGLEFARRAADARHPAEYWWAPSWLPIVALESGNIVCDTGGGAKGIAPIRVIESGHFDLVDFSAPRAASMGDLVEGWISAIDDGAWQFRGGEWSYNGEANRSAMHLLRLV